jgi:hypothetical protein
LAVAPPVVVVSKDHCASCTAAAGVTDGVADAENVPAVADGEPEGVPVGEPETVAAVDDGVGDVVMVDTVYVGAADGVLEPVADADCAVALGEPEGELVPEGEIVAAVALGVAEPEKGDMVPLIVTVSMMRPLATAVSAPVWPDAAMRTEMPRPMQ